MDLDVALASGAARLAEIEVTDFAGKETTCKLDGGKFFFTQLPIALAQ